MSFLKMLMVQITIYTALISWSANSWISIWMLLEVSFMTLMGLLMFSISYSLVESVMKYFIVQVLAGLMLLCCISLTPLASTGGVELILVLSLMVKMGMAPFHSWLISLLGKLDWLSFFILLSLSKVIPIVFVWYTLDSLLSNILVLTTVVVGSVAGLGNSSIQKLMGYSSMVSIGWVWYASSVGFFFFFFFWLGYVFMFGILCFMWSLMGIYYLNQFKFSSKSSVFKICMFLVCMSFSGIPPFLGFLMKWWVAWNLAISGSSFLVFMLVFLSLISLVYYLQLWFYFFMLGGLEFKWYSFSPSSLFLWFIILLFFVSYLLLMLFF